MKLFYLTITILIAAILSGCSSTTTPNDLQDDIKKMIELLEKSDKEAFVKEYFWGYRSATQTIGHRQNYFEHEVKSIDKHVIYCLKQSLIHEPRKHEKGPGGEYVEFLFSGPDGEDVFVYFMLGEYSDHWLMMNPN